MGLVRERPNGMRGRAVKNMRELKVGSHVALFLKGKTGTINVKLK